jgi:hypothetical protein
VPVGKLVYAILDNYAAHKHPKYAPGSPGTRAGRFISRPPTAPGPMWSRLFSPRSSASACSKAPSTRSSTYKPGSTGTSANTIANPSLLSGLPIPTGSSRNGNGDIKCWRQTTNI